MQVHARYPPGLHSHSSPEHQHQIRVNGTHADSRSGYPPPTGTISPSRAGDMHPYGQYQQYPPPQQEQEHQQYAAAPPPAPPLQQRQYPSHQLPSMFHTVNTGPPIPGMPLPAHPASGAMYNPTAQLPPPLSTMQQQQQQQQQHQHQQEPPRRPLSTTGSNGKYNFALRVEQQPARARMCGFGDKDRRPITPPPCIKLVITDMAGNVISPDDIDGSFFILQVDLWDEHASREVNIVRSNSSSPSTSISNASLTSFPPTQDRPQLPPAEFSSVMYASSGQAMVYTPTPYAAHPAMPQYPPAFYPGHAHLPAAAGPPHFGAYASGHPSARVQETSNLFTRNLIGSLTVNASVLKDPSGSENYWFVLQDLSVRTEGFFRLKMTFCDVGNPDGEGVNTGKAPLLASVFSDSFQVYSAKKFPGVIESTPLSKCFASQGIKIPIRKDVKAEERDDRDDRDEDED